MKKNLRNILALSLGLMTTVAFAQDWNVDSRTRIDMSGDYDKFEAAQRATVGTTWGGSDWSIHASTEVNYDLNGGMDADLSVYEAYASTDLMGYASLTAGRIALDYGSGLIIGSNQWGDRQVRDVMNFGLNLDFADVTVGYFSRMDAAELTNGTTGYMVNASKSDGDWNANLLLGSETATSNDVDGESTDYMGLDLGYNMMDGNLALDVSYNTMTGAISTEGETMADMDMTRIGATYSVNESMSVSASQTTYGEGGFNLLGSNYGAYGTDSWMSHGNIGHLGNDQSNMSFGGNYSMGAIDLGVTMHNVTSDVDDNYERTATELHIGYTLSDNTGLSLKYITDDNGTDTETNYTWLTVNIGL